MGCGDAKGAMARSPRRIAAHRRSRSRSRELARLKTQLNGKEYDSICSYSPDVEVASVASMPLESGGEINPPVETNTNNGTSEGPVPLTADILEALGEPRNKVVSYAPKIRDEISERWGRIVVDGLNKESILKLMDNIHIPENFKLLKAPELNPEITAVLSDSIKNRDKRLEKAQNHLGKGIAALTNLMSALIEGEMEKTDIIKKMSEIGQLLLDLHFQNTAGRRKLITFGLSKKFSNMVQEVKRDSLLFGENLGDKIKANKTAENSGLQVRRTLVPQPSTSSYRSNQPASRQGNSRGPPRAQVQRGRRGGPGNQAPPQSSKRVSAVTERYTTSGKTPKNRPLRKT